MSGAASLDLQARNRGRRILLIIAGLFFLPLATSFALYYGDLWRPADTSNHGTLIDPPRPLEAVTLARYPGLASVSSAAWLRGKWSLVYIGDGACSSDCRETLAFGRQVRLMLNNEMSRVQRIFLATGACCDSEYLEREQAGLLVASVGESTAAWLAQFPADERARTLFIVDPLGNLMMRYDTRQSPKDLQSDLKRLLKLSHIG